MIANSSHHDHPQSPLSLLTIDGDDATNFLQGQLTNDVSAFDKASWQWTALCNHQGRAVATFIIWHSDKQYRLLCQSDIAETAMRQLQKYVLRADVHIECSTATITVTEQFDHSKKLEIAPNVNLYVSHTRQNSCDNDLSHAQWQALIVNHRLPVIGQSLSGELIPNHFEFESFGGISYDKGCYVGQEVIARLHYLAKPQYGLYIIEADHSFSPGSLLYATQHYGDQPIGHVMASYDSNNMTQGLSCLKHKAVEQSREDQTSLSTDSQGNKVITVS